MDNYLRDLSAQSLRKLLIKEVEKFIKGLDSGNLEELALMKSHLTEIFNLLSEKERQEMAPILWGKNSTDFPELLRQLNLLPSDHHNNSDEPERR